MTIITVDLPDDIAEKARHEGLLSTQAIRELIEEATRISAMKRLKGMWQTVPADQQDLNAPTSDGSSSFRVELDFISGAPQRRHVAA